MENNNFLQNFDVNNLQVDYSQMQIPFINDILNAEIFGFNTLALPVRICVLFVSAVLLITTGKKLLSEIFIILKKFFRFIRNRYENLSEKKFNTLVSKQLNNKMAKASKFILLCSFNFRDHDNRIELLTEFSNAFLINNHADSIKYDKSSIIFEFSDFHLIINNIVTQLFITKTLFEKNYQGLEIYSSSTILEKDGVYEEKLNLINSLNNLKISKTGLVCDSIFNFYYSLIKPQLYEIQSVGQYLIQNNTVETFIMTKPIDRSL